MNELRKAPQALTIVGPGRVGSALTRACRAAGIRVRLLGRGDSTAGLEEPVLLCVPDAAIAEAAAGVLAGSRPSFLGHVSGATRLDPLLEHGGGTRAFSLHPLQTVPDGEAELAGAPCAVAGQDDKALAFARGLGEALGMRPFEVAEEDRAAYHAAASLASNFLVALEQSAAELLAGIGVDDAREVLAPLVLRSAVNWSDRGPRALTGPIARGDEATVEAHREAIASRMPDLLPVYDALARRARQVAAERGASR